MSTTNALKRANDTFKLNEQVDLGEFDLTLDNGEVIAEVKGNLKFRTLPTTHVYFSGTANPEKLPMTLMAIEMTRYRAFWDGLEIGNLVLHKFDQTTHVVEGEIFGNVIIGDKSVTVNTVRFLIPNMVEIGGDPIEYETKDISSGRQVFEDDKYIIYMDRISDFEKNNLEWQLRTGGVFFGHVCELKVKKGGASYQEIREIVSIFGYFLSLLNGRKTNPLIIEGIDDETDNPIWTDYTRYENYHGLHNRVHSIMQSKTKRNLTEFWGSFRKLFNDNNDRSFIQSAVNWYTEANCSTSKQSSIILSQTAMELIYNWLIVETKKIISGEDAKNINASNKFRLVAAFVKFDIDIDMSTVLKKNSTGNNAPKDLFEILVEVRNSLVHSQQAKRMMVESHPQGTLEESMNIFLYFIEISLLYICNYEGRFTSRLMNSDFRYLIGVPVPWHRAYKLIWENLNGADPHPELMSIENKLLYPDGK